MAFACLNAFAFSFSPLTPTDSDTFEKAAIPNLEAILNSAETEATPSGRLVIETGRSMINNGDIVLGSCWDYIDGVFKNAGFLSNDRFTAYKSKYQGPYLTDLKKIESGDWLYFVNHSYGDVEHSAIFVAWTNFDKKEAVMISYVGGSRVVPGRYKVYDLSSVYNIIRSK